MDVLGPGLVALPEFQPAGRCVERVVLVIGVFGAGFATANRHIAFQQEQMALLKGDP